jgi:hypothetical protein
VAADAIQWAARHNRREWWLGLPTVIAILGNKIAPGLGDLYLARTGYDSQMYDGAADPNRLNNLFEPVPGNYGAHGDFDDRAHAVSWQFWMNKHRKQLALVSGCLAGLSAAAILSQRSGSAEALARPWFPGSK